jgi:hypothetical protein
MRRFSYISKVVSFSLIFAGAVGLLISSDTLASTNVSLKWSKTISGIINESSPMPIQVNGGNQDIIFGAWDGDLHVLNGENGTEAAGWPQYTGYKIDSTPSSGDIDGDGKPEIFSGIGIADIECSGGGIASYTSTGVKRYIIDTPDAVPGPGKQCQKPAIHASPALGDINRDGQADITFGALGLKSWSFNQSGGRNFGWPFYWDDTQYGSPALADITGDGQTDVILPGDSSPGAPVDWQGGMVRAITGYGQPIWEFRTNEIVRSSPSIGDVTSDGDIEIVFGTGNYWSRNGGASDSNKIFVINRAGKLLCSHDVGAQVMASPTLADFSGDGVLDIAFGTWQKTDLTNDGKIWVLDGKTCSPLANYPVNSGGFLVIGQITSADINHDGAQDLIVPTANGVHAFDGKTAIALFTLNQGIASYKNAPLITDIDGNGQLDIIIAGTQGDGATGLVQRYEIGAVENAVAGSNNWPMFRRNTQETGSWTNVPLRDAPTGQQGQGYWLVAADGGVFPFGSAKGFGSTGGINLRQPIIGMNSTPSGQGYWLVAADGGIFPFGDAGSYGSAGNLQLTKPIVGMQRTPSGQGYWLVAADGGVFTYGDAGYFGSTGNINLRQPIVSMASTPSGQGYWLVAADGGVFPFGDAAGYGSTGNIKLTKPMVSMQRTPSGQGYWLVAADGGVFPFGDAAGYGSTGNLTLTKPIVGSTPSYQGGYTFVGGDGGIFNFNGSYYGSTGGLPLAKPVIGISYNF